MNEKISFQDIAEAISEKNGVTKKLSEDFLRELVAVIEMALQKDGVAKIKGLGTFKLQLVEERKSVNVQTGSEIVIPAHHKVSFAPEKGLKEAVNKPFAHLETYVLRDEGPVDPEPADGEDDELTDAPDLNAAEGVTSLSGKLGGAVAAEEPAESEVEQVDVNEGAESVEPQKAETEELEGQGETGEEAAECAADAETEEMVEKVEAAEPVSKDDIDEEDDVTASANERDKEVPVTEPERREAVSEHKLADNVASVSENDETEEPEEQKNKTLGYIILAFVVLCIFAITVIWYTDRSFFKKICNPDYNPIEVGSDKAPVINVKPAEEAVPAVVADSLSAADSASAEKSVAVTDSLSADSSAVSADSSVAAQPAEAPQAEAVADAAVKEETASQVKEAVTEKPTVKYDSNFKPDFINYMKAKHPNVSLETKGTKKVKVAKGQRLTTIALENYGDKNYWVYIYLYNYKVIKNPNSVNVGMKLLVPKLDKSLVDGANPVTMEMASEVRRALVEKKK